MRHHLVIVRATFSRCCLFGDSRSIRHCSSSSSLSYISTIITKPHASFLCLHLLLQVKIWATWIVILYKRGGQILRSVFRPNFHLFWLLFTHTNDIYFKLVCHNNTGKLGHFQPYQQPHVGELSVDGTHPGVSSSSL